MTAQKKQVHVFLLILALPLILACQYVERLIQVPEPRMETNVDRVLEVLSGEDWVPLQSLAVERYTEEDYAGPGTLTYTVTVDNDKPVYFSYGWCATDEATLRQNFEHIDVNVFLNEGELGSDVVHNFSYNLPEEGLTCLDLGVLLSDWPAGQYEMKAFVTFDETINDGLADYEAGDYVFVYTITVEEQTGP